MSQLRKGRCYFEGTRKRDKGRAYSNIRTGIVSLLTTEIGCPRLEFRQAKTLRMVR